MKTGLVHIIPLLLLCVGCSLEIEPQYEYAGMSGNNDCYTVRVRMPKNPKIVKAQLKPHKLTVEFDRGRDRGIVRWSYSTSNHIIPAGDSVQFRGANRIDGFALLYFTKEEDPRGHFNPPIGTTKISSNLKEQEAITIFRTGNWLFVHYSIKKTDLGRLIHHNLRERYAKNLNHIGNIASFKAIDGKMHYNLAFNNQGIRSFLIDKYYGQHETYGSSSGRIIANGDELRWTWEYKIDSNQDKDQ